jgi:hypothetical protein
MEEAMNAAHNNILDIFLPLSEIAYEEMTSL